MIGRANPRAWTAALETVSSTTVVGKDDLLEDPMVVEERKSLDIEERLEPQIVAAQPLAQEWMGRIVAASGCPPRWQCSRRVAARATSDGPETGYVGRLTRRPPAGSTSSQRIVRPRR